MSTRHMRQASSQLVVTPADDSKSRRSSVMEDYRPDLDEMSEFSSDSEDELEKVDSDVSSEKALEMLLQLQKSRPALYGEFTTEDLDFLAHHYLSTLVIGAEDEMITVGETASYFAILLKGTLQSEEKDVTYTLEPGDIFGTREYFNGGLRKAAVRASTASTVAVFTYSNIDIVSKHHPELILKVNHMLAMGVIIEMQAEIEHHKSVAAGAQNGSGSKPNTFHEAVRRSMNMNQHRQSAIQTTQSRRMSSIVDPALMAKAVAEAAEAKKVPKSHSSEESQPSSKGGVSGNKAEVLFRSRLNRAQRDHDQQLEDERAKRAAAEKTARQRHYKVMNRERLIKKQKAILEKQGKELSALRTECANNTRRIEEDTQLLDDLFAQRQQRETQMQELRSHIERLKEEHALQTAEILEVSRKKESTKLSTLRQQLIEARHEASSLRERHLSALAETRTRNEMLNERLQKESERRKSTVKHMNTFKATLMELERSFDEHEERYLRSTKQGLLEPAEMKKLMDDMKQVVNNSIQDPELRDHAYALMRYREKLHQSNRALQQASIEVQSLQTQVNRHKIMHSMSKRELMVAKERLKKQVAEVFVATTSNNSDRIISEKAYANLLMKLTVGNFVHHWKTRQALKKVQGHLLTVSMEMLSGLDGKKSAEFNFFHDMKQEIIEQRNLLLSGRYNAGNRGLSLLSQMKELVDNLSFVSDKLRHVYQHLQSQIEHMRVDSNAMLTRNIELKVDMRDKDEQLATLHETVANLRSKLKEKDARLEQIRRGNVPGAPSTRTPGWTDSQATQRSNRRDDSRLPQIAPAAAADSVTIITTGKSAAKSFSPRKTRDEFEVSDDPETVASQRAQRTKASSIPVVAGQDDLQQLKERLQDLEELNRFLFQTAHAQQHVAHSVGLSYVPSGAGLGGGAHTSAVLPSPLRAQKTHPHALKWDKSAPLGLQSRIAKQTVDIYSAPVSGRRGKSKPKKRSQDTQDTLQPVPPQGTAAASQTQAKSPSRRVVES